MKKRLLLVLVLIVSLSASAQVPKTIQLNPPSKSRNADIMKAFQSRKSSNVYQTKDLSKTDLSDLLWAANGINRLEEDKRTAPSALNSQDIDIYVCKSDGAYLYNPRQHALTLITTKDLRPLMNGNRPNDAPVLLLLVADLSRYKNYDPNNMEGNNQLRDMSALDAGIVSQNISLFCAAAELGTRPRASMNKSKLHTELSLKVSQILWLNHLVGYPK